MLLLAIVVILLASSSLACCQTEMSEISFVRCSFFDSGPLSTDPKWTTLNILKNITKMSNGGSKYYRAASSFSQFHSSNCSQRVGNHSTVRNTRHPMTNSPVSYRALILAPFLETGKTRCHNRSLWGCWSSWTNQNQPTWHCHSRPSGYFLALCHDAQLVDSSYAGIPLHLLCLSWCSSSPIHSTSYSSPADWTMTPWTRTPWRDINSFHSQNGHTIWWCYDEWSGT